MAEPDVQSTGSEVADAFVGAVAAGLADGAARHVQEVSNRYKIEESPAQEEVARLRLLAEQAAFTWARQSLRHAGEETLAAGLASLRGGQASYAAVMLQDKYAPQLEISSTERRCCDAAAASLAIADRLDDVSATPLETGAAQAGQTLTACFASGALNSVIDELIASLDLIFEEARPLSSLSWQERR